MSPIARLCGLLTASLLLAACKTTGDPRQGGLFGWSEAKARDRQAERQERVTEGEHALARENARSQTLEAHDTATSREIIVAKAEHQRSEERLRTQQSALLAKIDRLETESPTPATASRVRTYRQKVNTITAQTALTPAQRSERLRMVELEIDHSLERLKQ